MAALLAAGQEEAVAAARPAAQAGSEDAARSSSPAGERIGSSDAVAHVPDICLLCVRDGKTERHHGPQHQPKPTFAPAEDCDIELAWAAGFFDGEGYTTRNGRYLSVGISQLDVRPLERFLAAVGAGSITRTTRPDRISQWRAGGSHAYRVMEKLWPALSEPKREQFLRVEALTE